MYDSNPGLANAAYEALRQLGDDQSQTVSEAASRSLTAYDRAQRQLRLAGLYERAQMSILAEDWGDAHAVLTELLKEDADYHDASSQLELVETKIKTAGDDEQAREPDTSDQKQEDISSAYALGIKQYQARQLDLALRTFRKVQSMDASYKNTHRYIEVIQKELARQRHSAGQSKNKLWPILLGGCGVLICLAACIFIGMFSGY
jgi:hypothetical protein